MMSKRLAFIAALLIFVSCAPGKKAFVPTSSSKLLFLDSISIPFHTEFAGAKVGGLSGIEYQKHANQYLLLSDDRSEFNPARFYTMRFALLNDKIKQFAITEVDTITRTDGSVYPNEKEDRNKVPDPEDLRFSAKRGLLVWSSEGERKGDVLIDPSINVARPDGGLLYSLVIQDKFKMQKDRGPRRNGVFEGLTFDPSEKYLFVSMEEPLLQDGPRAALEGGPFYCRILKYEFDRMISSAEYAYPLDKVPAQPIPENGFYTNGISAIQSLDDKRLLVLERAYVQGVGNSVRLYLADLGAAENIIEQESLADYKPQKPITKTLVADFSQYGIHIDNLEGLTFGPRLPNGNPTLVLVSDNNFSQDQVTQILVFEWTR